LTRALAPTCPAEAAAKGIVPFFLSDVVRIAIIVTVPATATWLTGL
jgi:TRAP-type C4-dicarboxylate transport system permease large subunit